MLLKAGRDKPRPFLEAGLFFFPLWLAPDCLETEATDFHLAYATVNQKHS